MKIVVAMCGADGAYRGFVTLPPALTSRPTAIVWNGGVYLEVLFVVSIGHWSVLVSLVVTRRFMAAFSIGCGLDDFLEQFHRTAPPKTRVWIRSGSFAGVVVAR